MRSKCKIAIEWEYGYYQWEAVVHEDNTHFTVREWENGVLLSTGVIHEDALDEHIDKILERTP